MAKLIEHSRYQTLSTGTGGPLTLDTVVSGFNTVAQGGGASGGAPYCYVLQDGSNFEWCNGVPTTGSPWTITRNTLGSTNGGSPISLSGAASLVFSPAPVDLINANRAAVSDANYTAADDDRTIAYTAITAARTVSLPAAADYAEDFTLTIMDESGSCSATKTITAAANGSDTINGESSVVLNQAYARVSLKSNGSNAWTICEQAQEIIPTDGASVSASGSTISLGGPGGMVNALRNGTMDVWQRGTSAITVTTSGAYTADGWIVTPTGASCTAQQASNNRSGANTLYGLQLTGASSVTDIKVSQRIESYIAARLAGKTVTVQAQVYNNTGAAITPTLTTQYAGSTDVWSSPTTDLSATNLQSCASGAWTKVAYTLLVSANAAKGYAFILDFGNNFSTTGKDVIVAELDVRVTPSATAGLCSNPPPPELRPIGEALQQCERYYYDPANGGSSVAFGFDFYSASTGAQGQGFISFPVTMRVAPTITFRNQSYSNGSTLITNTVSAAGFSTAVDASGGGANTGASFNIAASAEL